MPSYIHHFEKHYKFDKFQIFVWSKKDLDTKKIKYRCNVFFGVKRGDKGHSYIDSVDTEYYSAVEQAVEEGKGVIRRRFRDGREY